MSFSLFQQFAQFRQIPAHQIRLVGGVIRAIHVNDRVERLFHLAGIDKVIEIEKEKSWMKAGSQKEDSYGTHQ